MSTQITPPGLYPSNSEVQQFILKINQANSDAKYQTATLPDYQGQLANWIALNTHSREIFAQTGDPNAYVPTAPPAKPQRTVWSIDPATNGPTSTLVPDPTIPDAALPPFVGNQSTSHIASPAPPDPVMSVLMAIYQQNSKIMAAMGIKS
jgi:hypothetical protein